MSVVFLGTTEFAAAVLDGLAASDQHRPSLVLTRPDRPRGRGQRLASPPVADAARRLGLELRQPERINDPDARALIGDSRQTVVVCAFGALIKEPLLSEHEMLNVHPSLLPRWRGAAPVERAIMAADAETGVSIIRLTAGLDSGPVCMSGSEPILAQDTYGTLSVRLQALAADLLLRTLDLKAQGNPPPFAEQDEAAVTYAEKIGAEDRLLDPELPAAALERRVRALDPHIGTRAQLPDGTFIGVHRAALASEPDATDASKRAPAARGVVAVGERLLLRCRDGDLEMLVVQPPGGRAMDAASFLRGHRASLG